MKRTKKFHGMWGTPTYRSWNMMKNRCNNPKNSQFSYYGGRGITYDPKWETFEGFLEDMGIRPEGSELDKKDNNKNYCKDNCRWTTRGVQNHNQRKKELSPLGKKPSSRFIGVSYDKRTGRWSCQLQKDGKYLIRKLFSTEFEAATAYDDISFEVYKDRPNEKLLSEYSSEEVNNIVLENKSTGEKTTIRIYNEE